MRRDGVHWQSGADAVGAIREQGHDRVNGGTTSPVTPRRPRTRGVLSPPLIDSAIPAKVRHDAPITAYDDTGDQRDLGATDGANVSCAPCRSAILGSG
jgi:hypothetical protein